MIPVHELFAMSNEALVEAWQEALIAEREARAAKQQAAVDADMAQYIAADERKLEARIIRRVIIWLMGRDLFNPRIGAPASETDED
jgi:hypothetical protein